LPNLLEHAQKRELEKECASVVIGALLGTLDGKMLDISNSIPMILRKNSQKNK